MRKIYSYLLMIMMIFAIASPIVIVKAQDAETVDVVANITDENNIVTYENWAAAVENAKNGDTLKSLSDIEQSGETIEITKTLNIDLNKHTVSGIYANANDIGIKISNGSFSTIGEMSNITGASVEIENCDLYFVELTNQAGLKMVNSWVRMGIDAPVKNAENEFVNCQIDNTIDIRGGEAVEVYISGENSNVHALNIFRTSDACAQINGGTIATVSNCGETYVNDGIVTGGFSAGEESKIYLNGGKYTLGAKTNISTIGMEKIVFPEGKRLVRNGDYYELGIPTESDYMVTDGTTKYLSWKEALSDAPDGATLTALCNSIEKITIPSGKKISLDFGDFEYSRGLNIEKEATLTVLGGAYRAGIISSSAESWVNQGILNIVEGSFYDKVFDVNSSQGWGFTIENYGTVHIQGGTFTGLGNVVSRNVETKWGDTYITGGTFVKDSLGYVTFWNGNSNETNQHVFISKGTYCNELKELVAANILTGADAQIVDLADGNFQIMTAAEAKAYEEENKKKEPEATPQPTTTPQPTMTPQPTATPQPTTTPQPENDSQAKESPAVTVGEIVVLQNKDNSGAKYVVATVGAATNTVKVSNGKSAKGKVTIKDKITDATGKTYTITEIAPGAYKNAVKLTKVDLSKGQIAIIGKDAFRGAKKLTNVMLNGNAIQKIGKNAFKGVKKNCKIVIKAKNKTIYKKIVKQIRNSGAKKVKCVYKKG